MTPTGEVFNLSKLEEFEGDYGAVEAGLTIGKGIVGVGTMSNEHCVYINAKAKSEGLKLSAPGPTEL